MNFFTYEMLAQEQIENLEKRLEDARKLLHEAVDKYPVESDPKTWTSRVREWLKNGT